NDLVDQPALAQVGVLGSDNVILTPEQAYFAQILEIDELGTNAVVDVVIVVGNLVGQVGDLRFEAGLAPVEETLTELAQLAGVTYRTMFEDAFTALEGQVETTELRIALFQLIHHAQGLDVVLEPSIGAHTLIQRILAGVTEWSMAEIVRKADGLRERLVQPQSARHGLGDLGNFDRMGYPGAIQVAFVIDEDLRFVNQTPEGIRMDDAVAVALELAAEFRFRLRMAATARVLVMGGVWRKRFAGGDALNHAGGPKYSRKVRSRAASE